MDYQRVYNQIVERGQIRVLEEGVYCEVHHIIPRCMDGQDERENLVVLTAREHFLVHWLLTKIYPENYKLIHAFWMMCNIKNNKQKRYIPSSRTYQEARELFSKIHSKNSKGHKRTEESIEKQILSYSLRTEEQRLQTKEQYKETFNLKSEKERENILSGLKQNWGLPRTQESIEKGKKTYNDKTEGEKTEINKKKGLSKLGKPRDEATKERIRKTNSEKSPEQKLQIYKKRQETFKNKLPEEITRSIEKARETVSKKTPEEREEIKILYKESMLKKSPDEMSESERLRREPRLKRTPEQKEASRVKGGETRRGNKELKLQELETQNKL